MFVARTTSWGIALSSILIFFTAFGCRYSCSSLRADLHRIRRRDTLIPPPVLPAQAPTNIRITRMVLENTGHTLKSLVAYPVVFMILFGINFNAYYLLLTKKVMQAAKNEEVRYYLGIIGLAIVAIAINTREMFTSFGRAFQQAAFQVGSTGKRQQAENKYQYSHSANPVGKASPDQHTVRQSLHITQNTGSSRGKTGNSLKYCIYRMGNTS